MVIKRSPCHFCSYSRKMLWEIAPAGWMIINFLVKIKIANKQWRLRSLWVLFLGYPQKRSVGSLKRCMCIQQESNVIGDPVLTSPTLGGTTIFLRWILRVKRTYFMRFSSSPHPNHHEGSFNRKQISLRIVLARGQWCYFSRSRQRIVVNDIPCSIPAGKPN